MASNTRPQFKHPIQTAAQNVQELSWITEDMLMAAVGPNDGLRQINWNGLRVIVRSMITLDEMQELVSLVWEQCWDEASVHPELADFLLRRAVIVFYTNVNLPESVEEQYAYLYGTDLYEKVTPCISVSQLKSIEDALKIYLSK